MEAKGMMKMADLTRACGVSDQAVRLYEREGLLHPVGRTGKGYRLYDARSVETLKFIKQAQRCGFKLTEIGTLIQANITDPEVCSVVKALLDHKIKEILEQLVDLQSVKGVLQSLRAACDGDPGPACPAFLQLCTPHCALPNPKAKSKGASR